MLAKQKEIATEKDFLQFNLLQENERIKSLQRAAKEGGRGPSRVPENRESLSTTSKKNKALPYGDGFNDDEIQMVSPPKLVLRPKATTPKAGEKRKRKALESKPVQPLPLSQAKKENQQDDPDPIPNEDPPEAVEIPRNDDKERFKACSFTFYKEPTDFYEYSLCRRS